MAMGPGWWHYQQPAASRSHTYVASGQFTNVTLWWRTVLAAMGINQKSVHQGISRHASRFFQPLSPVPARLHYSKFSKSFLPAMPAELSMVLATAVHPRSQIHHIFTPARNIYCKAGYYEQHGLCWYNDWTNFINVGAYNASFSNTRRPVLIPVYCFTNDFRLQHRPAGILAMPLHLPSSAP